MAYARRTLRIRPITTAARSPDPATSPMATPMRPSGSSKASNQSPPTPKSSAGTKRLANSRPVHSADDRGAGSPGRSAPPSARPTDCGDHELLGDPVASPRGRRRPARRTGGCRRADVHDAEQAAIAISGTPSIARKPVSQRIGLTTVSGPTSSSTTGARVAAIRPAKPAPTGTRTPWCTSSSSPRRRAPRAGCPHDRGAGRRPCRRRSGRGRRRGGRRADRSLAHHGFMGVRHG